MLNGLTVMIYQKSYFTRRNNILREKFKHINKKIIIIFGTVIIIITIIIGIVYKIKQKNKEPEKENKEIPPITVMEDGTKVNTKEKLNEAKLVNDLLISNIQLTEKNGVTTLLANITNKGEKKTEFKRLKIVFLDEKGNEISSATAFLSPLEVGETTQLNASTTSNYINAYDFKIEEN